MATETVDCHSGPKFLCGVVEGFYGRPWTAEQRRDLFVKMRRWQLNTYMYAPKDDLKHRAQWRDPYTVEQAEELRSIADAARENSVDLYYAISPGLDIIYSNAKEIAILKRKLEQLRSFGVSAFAILFDDIEPEIGSADKEVFQTFAQAQVAVTNEIYQSLGQPKFIFCPTEYCASRAVPNVQSSEYLSTIGQKLLQGIDIMWTGNKVISKTISLKSIQELQDVLRRPPLIWDNLHANDYDRRRVFLGPYSGRSTRLIPHLRGVLTNPNCEYEPNFVAIHTLAQWSRCTTDACKSAEDSSSCESVDSVGSSASGSATGRVSSTAGQQQLAGGDVPAEAEEEAEGEAEVLARLPAHSYHPRRALHNAIREWLTEFNEVTKSAHGHVAGLEPAPPVPPVTVATVTLPVAAVGTAVVQPGEVLAPPLSSELVNTLVKGPSSSSSALPGAVGGKPNGLLEPMDCNPTPPQSPPPSPADPSVEQNSANSLSPALPCKAVPEEEMQTEEGSLAAGTLLSTSTDANTVHNPTDKKDGRTETLGSPEKVCSQEPLDFSEVALLVDLFYLPFEHGRQGVELLHDFAWLRGNAHYMGVKRNNTEVEEWYRRANKIDQMTKRINLFSQKLMFIPNRSLLYDLNPYVWDIKGVIGLINAYVKWIGSSKGHGKKTFLPSEPEPWVFRGGLAFELQRLFPFDTIHDLFLCKAPDTPVNKTFTIRPYLHSDEKAVYEVCSKTCADGNDGTMEFEGYPDLIGDRTIGGFLVLSSELCFVVEDEHRIVGYALAALNAADFYKKMDIAWNAELREKYPLPLAQSSIETVSSDQVDSTSQAKSEQDDQKSMSVPTSRAIDIINELHNRDSTMIDAGSSSSPPISFAQFPSILVMALLPRADDDGSLAKRILACAIAALKANGSHGVHVRLSAADLNMAVFYARLGFVEIARDVGDIVVFGRMF